MVRQNDKAQGAPGSAVQTRRAPPLFFKPMGAGSDARRIDEMSSERKQ